MVRVWFMDDDVDSDQRLEHQRSPPEFVDVENLFQLTGVEYFKVRWKSRRSEISANDIRSARRCNSLLEKLFPLLSDH